MYEGTKVWIKTYSLILLTVLILRSFLRCKGSFKEQITTGITTGSLIPVIIFIANV